MSKLENKIQMRIQERTLNRLYKTYKRGLLSFETSF